MINTLSFSLERSFPRPSGKVQALPVFGMNRSASPLLHQR
jgi:hypothetical protein